MPKVRTTETSLESTYTSVFAPLGCFVLAAASALAALLGDGGNFKTSVATFGAVFCVWGATVFMEKAVIRIDRAAGTVSVLRKRVRKTENFQIPLASVTAVRTEYSLSEGTRSYRTCLGTADRWIPLTTAFGTESGESRKIRDWFAENGIEVAFEEGAFDPEDTRHRR